MKAKRYNWLVKVAYVDENYQHVVKYINTYKATKQEVIRYNRSYPKNSVVNIYKLEDILYL